MIRVHGLRTLSALMKKDKRMHNWIGLSDLVKHALSVLSSPTSLSPSTSTTSTLSNPQVISIEEKEGLLQLFITLIRDGLSIDNESELLRVASIIEEEASEKSEEEKDEKESEKWERLEDAATKLIKTLKKKKGEKSTLSGIEKEKAEVEGFGIVYIEANMYGKFVIGTREGGIPDAILNNKTGILIKSQDKDPIVKTLKQLYDADFKYDPNDCLEWAKKMDVNIIAQQYMKEINNISKKDF